MRRCVGWCSIRRRALDLLYGMCDTSNAKDIVEELLKVRPRSRRRAQGQPPPLCTTGPLQPCFLLLGPPGWE